MFFTLNTTNNITTLVNDKVDLNKLKTSQYQRNQSILINDSIGSMNDWEWAKANGLVNNTGDGTVENPYKIEHINFTGIASPCLTILNSNKHFEIRDCFFIGLNYKDGLKLDNVSNGLIINCTIVDNIGTGITLDNVNFTTIHSCVILNSGGIGGGEGDGILMLSCINITIEENKINDNNNFEYIAGIEVQNSENITIFNNTINRNGDGIALINSEYNYIINNTIDNTLGGYGISLGMSDNNLISYNNISNTLLDWYAAISISDSFNCNVTYNYLYNNEGDGLESWVNGVNTLIMGNIFENNKEYGIELNGGSVTNNIIYKNYFINNSINAYDMSPNDWDNGSVGNYWDDYKGKDSNMNGIGDSPYLNITGPSGNTDDYPIFIEPGVDIYERNNDFGSAALIILNNNNKASENMTINPPGEEDFYKISMTKGSEINVLLWNLPANYDLYLYYPNETLISSSINTGTIDEQITYTDAWTLGFYYIKISDSDGSPGKYYLNISVIEPPLSELWTFPMGTWTHSSAALADLDNDGNLEVVVGNGDKKVYAIHAENGTELWNYTTGDFIESSPSIGDVDNDGKPEVIIGCLDTKLYVLNGEDGSEYWNFTTASNIVKQSPVLGDVDNDGILEIIIASGDWLYVLNGDDKSVEWFGFAPSTIRTTPALGDLDNDGNLEIVFGCRDNDIYALHAENGSILWTYTTGGWADTSPSLGDIDSDGTLEVIAGSDDNHIYALNGEDGNQIWNYTTNDGVDSSPALGDIDFDGKLEIVVGDAGGDVYCLNAEDGSELWTYDAGFSVLSSFAIGDLDADRNLEVVIGSISSGDDLRILNGEDGSVSWSYDLGIFVEASPILGDIDEDGKLEIIIGDCGNNLRAINPSFSGNRIYWQGYAGGNNFYRNKNQLFLDSDLDFLSNYSEVLYSTESNNSDTDGDGLTDGDEVGGKGTDPNNQDTDGDGLPDWWEFVPLNNGIWYNLTAGTTTLWNVDNGVIYKRIDITSTGLCAVRMISGTQNPESTNFKDGLFYFSIDLINESRVSYPVHVKFYIPDSITSKISYITLYHFNGADWVQVDDSLLIKNGIGGWIEYDCSSFSTYSIGILPDRKDVSKLDEEEDTKGNGLLITLSILTISLASITATMGLLAVKAKISLYSRKSNKSVYTKTDSDKKKDNESKKEKLLLLLEKKLALLQKSYNELTNEQREKLQFLSNKIMTKIEDNDDTKIQNLAVQLIKNQLLIWKGDEEVGIQNIKQSKERIEELSKNSHIDENLKKMMIYLKSEVENQYLDLVKNSRKDKK